MLEAAAATAFVFFVCEYFHPLFFFMDESARQDGPIFQYIGQEFLHGRWPALSIDVWQGGDLLGENQYGLLNPVTLLTSIVSALCPTTRCGILAIDVIYTLLIWFGATQLARNFGMPRILRSLFAFLLISNNLLIYWFTSNWAEGMIGQTWFVWTLACLTVPVLTTPWLIAGACCLYLAINSGWPHAMIAATLFTGCLGLTSLIRRDWPRVFALGLILVSAFVASLPGILATKDWLTVAFRESGFLNHWFLVPVLSDILNFGSPTLLPHLLAFGGKDIAFPTFYVAWFGWLAFVLVRPKWEALSTQRLMALAMGGGLMLLVSLGPEQFGPLRWPFRFVPFFQIALLLIILVLVHESPRRTASLRLALIAMFVVLVPQIITIEMRPANLDNARFVAVLLVVCVGLLAFPVRRRSPYLFHYVALSILIVFVVMHGLYPFNTSVPDATYEWQDPAFNRHATIDTLKVNDRFAKTITYTFTTLPRTRPEHVIQGYFRLASGERFLNGYTPADHTRLAQLLCMDYDGSPACDQALPTLFSKESISAVSYADLMRVATVVVGKQNVMPPPSGWHVGEAGNELTRWVRDQPLGALPGTVSYVGKAVALAATPTPQAEASRETHIFEISEAAGKAAPDPLARSIIFARLWWPGYTAEVNGINVPVRAHDGLLARIDLPPDIAGRTTVSLAFRPLADPRGLLLPLGAIVLILGAGLLHRWQRGSPGST